MRYTNYTNLDSRFCRTYEQGDRLVKGWEGEVDRAEGEVLTTTLERLFMKHNRDDRPDGQLCPSMSIGDVVLLHADSGDKWQAWSVDDCGFVQVLVDPADLITDRTWREVDY